METKNELRPDLQDVIKKVRALRQYTKTTGFLTNRSVSEILKRLVADDLATVAMELEK
jgi:hypothetical protein